MFFFATAAITAYSHWGDIVSSFPYNPYMFTWHFYMLVGKAVTLEFYNFNVCEYFESQSKKTKASTAPKLVNKPTAEVTLNPTELAWAQVKRYFKDNNKQFNLNHLKELTCNGFTKVRPSQWKTVVDPVQAKVEDTFWEQDGLHEQHLDELYVLLTDSIKAAKNQFTRVLPVK